MTTIISQRHKLKFYFSILFGAIFLLGMGTALLIVFIKSSSRGDLKSKDYLMPVFSLTAYSIAIYTVYRYYRNAPKIQVDSELISFNHETFSWTDLTKIELTGKKPFQYLIDFPMEATLQFKDGRKKYIFDDMYENSWEIKSFLKQVVVDKKEFIEKDNQPIIHSELDSDFYETLKGNQFTSLRGISLWSLLGFFAYMLLTSSQEPAIWLIIFSVAFSSFWFIFHSWLMHYFEISQTYFVVRNHNLTWKRRAYRLSDIKEIVFETQGKMPNCLRVITNNFKNKLYPAGTLRDKTWLELKDKLESYKIKVRNECI
jgi:ABC-type multidrug transport system fused ATPase/permease subunit